MRRASLRIAAVAVGLLFAPHARAERMAPTPDVAVAPTPQQPVPQVVEPITIAPGPNVVPIPVAPPVAPPIEPEPIEPAPIVTRMPTRPAQTVPRYAMSADVTFGPAFPISAGLAADERIGETFRYHVSGTMEGFYLGLTFGQILDSNGVFLQFANRFGYDLWFPIDATLAFGVDFYAAIGMFYSAPTPHSGGSTDGFAALELENGLEVKLIFSGGFYIVARPVGLAYFSSGSTLGGATFLDVSGGVGFAF